MIERADGVCEYCLIHESDTYFGCHIDHVIGVKHGGLTATDNLAYSCACCHRAKGTDLGTVLAGSGVFARLYDLRSDSWRACFVLEGVTWNSQHEIGEATIQLRRLNSPHRRLEREALMRIGRYPPPEALRLIAGDR